NLLIRTVGDIKEDSPILLDARMLLGRDSQTKTEIAITKDATEFEVTRGEDFPYTDNPKDPSKPIPFEVTVYDVNGSPGNCEPGVKNKERMRVREHSKSAPNVFKQVERGILLSKDRGHCADARVALTSNALGIGISDEWTLTLSYSNSFGINF